LWLDRGRATVPPAAQVTHLSVFNWRGQGAHVTAADDQGNLRLYARNGTKRGDVAVATSRISGLLRSGTTFAVAEGAAVRFVATSRWKLSPAVCRGPAADVSGLAFDALSPGVLHVAYATGELLAFHARARSGESGAPQRAGRVASHRAHRF